MENTIIYEHELVPYAPHDLPHGPYLVFAPHPDDETLGMGGTIALAVEKGIDVSVVFATNGEKGGDPDVRKKEAEAAVKVLGVKKLFYLNLPDREIFSTPFPEERVAQIMEEVTPSTVFLPSLQEIHPDHRAMTHKVLSFSKRKQYVYDLWLYEINRHGEINRLIDITHVVDKKEQAIVCFQSQLEQLDYKSNALCLDFTRGVTLGQGSDYAEGFWRHGFSPENESPEQAYSDHILKYHLNQGGRGAVSPGNENKKPVFRVFDSIVGIVARLKRAVSCRE
ncbi:MAG: PIG-L family deacetylase [Desulfobacterium sp.]|nr:PIG-L family deacetylase [Desulfobacterium sp.]